MKSKEFHSFIGSLYGDELKSHGFAKGSGSSAWVKDTPDHMAAGITVSLGKFGWLPMYGSEFMYHVNPRYDKKPVLNVLHKQLTLRILKHYDPEILGQAAGVLNRFASKLPEIEGYTDSVLFVSLKSHWTEEKVSRSINHWYRFYDQEDVQNWYDITHKAVLMATDDILADYEEKGLEKAKKEASSLTSIERIIIVVDPVTGKIITKPSESEEI